jgi:hypothetical protein
LRFSADHQTASTAIPAGATTGAALVDVVSWRLRGANKGEPLRLRVELATTSNRAVAAALVGSGVETFTAAATIDIPAFELLPASTLTAAAAAASMWFPREDGDWYVLSPPKEDNAAAHTAAAAASAASAASGDGGRGKQTTTQRRVRLRVCVVEGLELRPLRLPLSTSAAAASGLDRAGSSDAATIISADLHRLALADAAGESAASVAASSGSLSADSGGSVETHNLKLRRVHQLELVWWSRNTGSTLELSAWAPVCPPGTASLGTVVVPCFNAPSEALVALAPWTNDTVVVGGSLPPTAAADGFTRVWQDGGSRSRKNPEGTAAVWRPIAPEGYVAVGCVVTPNHFPPEPRDVACVRANLAQLCAPAPAPLWTAHGSGEKLGGAPLSVYRTGVAAGAGWTAVASHKREDAAITPPSWEIRWDVGAGARVDDGTDVPVDGGGGGDDGGDDGASHTGPMIALGPNGPWAPVGSRQLGAASAAAVAVGPARASAVVVDRRGGCLRAPAVLSSHLPFAIEARLVTLPTSSASSSSLASSASSSASSRHRVPPAVEVFESERFFPFVGWSEPKGQLDEFFTGRFNDVRGAGSTSYFKDVPLPEGWRWDSQWELDLGVDVDKAGWAYGSNWVMNWPPPRGAGSKGLSVTRRRRWFRRRVPIATEGAGGGGGGGGLDDGGGGGSGISAKAGSWSGLVHPPGALAGAVTLPLPLPLGCGGAATGGSPSLGLDVRVLLGGGTNDNAPMSPPTLTPTQWWGSAR